MKVEEMRAASATDAEVFCFAALFNRSILSVPACRAELEKILSGTYQLDLYKRRCAQLRQDNRWFEPSPLNKELFDDGPQDSTRPADVESVKALSVQLTTLTAKVQSISMVTWVVAALATGAIYLTRH